MDQLSTISFSSFRYKLPMWSPPLPCSTVVGLSVECVNTTALKQTSLTAVMVEMMESVMHCEVSVKSKQKTFLNADSADANTIKGRCFIICLVLARLIRT